MKENSSVDMLCMHCMTSKNKEGICQICGFDESSNHPSLHQLPFRTILNGKYLVGRVLGEGGFGITYLGWDLNLDLKIAIKEYYPTGFVTRENTATNTVHPYAGEKSQFFQSGREKFVDEAKRLAKFYAFPGIVSIKDFFLENETAYIVMEYIEGQTFKQYLQSMGGNIPAAQMFEMMKPLMKSLSDIHKSGMIHRDISPDNIMITKEGYIKLLDFGAARDFAGSGNKSLSVMLKPGYAPEEQYRSRGVQGPWTDIYALCATIYKAITGVTPDESNERIRGDELVNPTQLGVSIIPHQEAALMKGMSVLQENRFQTIEELSEAIYMKNDQEIIKAPEIPIQPIPENNIVQPAQPDQPAQQELPAQQTDISDIKNQDININDNVYVTDRNIQQQVKPTNKALPKIILAAVSAVLLLVAVIAGVKYYEKVSIEKVLNAATTIKISAYIDDPMLSFVKDVIEKEQPNVTIELETIDYETYQGFIEDGKYADEMGDIILVRTTEDSSVWDVASTDLGQSHDYSAAYAASAASGGDSADDIFVDLSGLQYLSNLAPPLSEEYTELKSPDGNQYVVPCSRTLGFVVNSQSVNIRLCKYILNNLYNRNSDFYSAMFIDAVTFDNQFENGNTSGNMSSGGTVVQQEDCVYFSFYTGDSGTYRLKLDGSEPQKISSEKCYYMAVEDDWLYYYSLDDKRISRMKTDGSENTLLTSVGISGLSVVDGWVYYAAGSSGLYKMRTDGSEVTQVTENSCCSLTVYDNWIFYLKDNFFGGQIYRMRLDGSENICICTDEAEWLNVVDGMIYYSNTADNDYIYKMDISGDEKTSLNQTDSSFVNVSGAWIYYESGEDDTIYKMKTDGSYCMKVRDYIPGELQLVNGEVFDISDYDTGTSDSSE